MANETIGDVQMDDVQIDAPQIDAPQDDTAMDAKKRGWMLLWMLLASNASIEDLPEDDSAPEFQQKKDAYNKQAEIFLAAPGGSKKLAAAKALEPLQNEYALAIYKGLTSASGPIAGITEEEAVQMVKQAIDVAPAPMHDVTSKRAAFGQTQAIFQEIAVNSNIWPGTGGHPAATDLAEFFPEKV